MNTNKHRRHFTAEEKVKVLRRHLLEKVPVSDLCEEAGIHPTQFYDWQKVFFEKGALAFERSSRPEATAREQRIAFLEAKLQRKDEVLSELMEEHVALKKNLGAR
ncbi:MAG: transposase [Deltaproteobacteria bacterium]|nr:transposase [Deltaproteobacteria bacterium]